MNPLVETPNRGKRSITLDLTNPAGHDVLMKLVATADVFLTNNLPRVCEKLQITVEQVRAANPSIIYARGTGWGAKGPMAETGGFDLASAWASSGFAHHITPPGGEPPMQPAGFYDLQGGGAVAGAIAMALFKRERTGEPSVVDVSLLSVGMWSVSPGIGGVVNRQPITRRERLNPANPVVNWYRTADERWLYLVLLQADKFWAELCQLLGRPDLIADERFADATVRYANRAACVAELDAVFGSKTLAEWHEALDGFSGVWAPVLSYEDLHHNDQVDANGFLPPLENNAGTPFRIVAPPMQFDEQPTLPQGPAPEVGQHTEEILLDAGFEWDEIAAAREAGALG